MPFSLLISDSNGITLTTILAAMSDLYVDVILPLALQNTFTYRVPDEMKEEVAAGKRVIVPFGKNKLYSAVILNVHESYYNIHELKEVQAVLDEQPVVHEKQFELWKWMAGYYMCTLGEVMNAALPAPFKLQSETKVSLVEREVNEQLSEAEEQLFQALEGKDEITIAELARQMNRASVYPLLKKAFEKNLVLLHEEIRERYKPRMEARVRLGLKYEQEEALEELFAELEMQPRKKKQVETLMVFMKLLFEDPGRASVKKQEVLKYDEASPSSLKSLIADGVLIEYSVSVDRIPVAGNELIPPMVLSDAQDVALEKIREAMKHHPVTLLHGVTSSGKTEIYTHLIEEVLKQGKQVLYLLPEIALTTQLIIRLQRFFGSRIGVYHSRYSNNERVEIWNHVLNFDPAQELPRSQIVLGARSALFLPYKNLGLIIVDEEHDQSYKQSDPAPRYQGRDSAIMLAEMHGAKTLLGSATPSLESYFNASQQRYGLVTLTERHGGIEMPEIIVADVKEAKRKKLMKSHFTQELLSDIHEALQKKEQVILFQNRRGFSNYLECKNCDWIPHCQNCTVTLTYHKKINALKCHYCGYFENVPSTCKRCGGYQLEVRGFGTEKIEEEIALFFPDARVARMDLDSTRTRTSYHKFITDFEDRKIDILVGTQMVTKGLDFDNVSTVGIINADQLLNYPDFRSFERSYQLMAQVSGRSGRKSKRGKVIIQTNEPGHWVIRRVVENDYDGFFKRDMMEREKFGYPPYSRLIEMKLRHKDDKALEDASMVFAEKLRANLGSMVYGPHVPFITRIRNLYYREILIKIDRKISPSEIKKIIFLNIKDFFADRSNQPVQIIPDVDPV